MVSGGQTGVDRAALDAALAHGLAVGGWCPRGRRAEDGAIPECYPLTETDSRDYADRTRANVRNSDGSLILGWGTLTGGTRLTAECARAQAKPCLIVDLTAAAQDDGAVARVGGWIASHGIRTLNVAGPRASEAPDAYAAAFAFVAALLAVRRS